MEQVQVWATSGSSDSLVNLGDNVTSPKNKTPKQVEACGTSGSTWKKLMAKKTFFTKKRKHFLPWALVANKQPIFLAFFCSFFHFVWTKNATIITDNAEGGASNYK